jgi:hypothetical protein
MRWYYLKGFAQFELYYKHNWCVTMANCPVTVYVMVFPTDDYKTMYFLRHYHITASSLWSSQIRTRSY